MRHLRLNWPQPATKFKVRIQVRTFKIRQISIKPLSRLLWKTEILKAGKNTILLTYLNSSNIKIVPFRVSNPVYFEIL